MHYQYITISHILSIKGEGTYMQPTVNSKGMWTAGHTKLSACSGKISLKLMYADIHLILHCLVLSRHVCRQSVAMQCTHREQVLKVI